jgi:hypothetical protein
MNQTGKPRKHRTRMKSIATLNTADAVTRTRQEYEAQVISRAQLRNGARYTLLRPAAAENA